MRKKDQHRTTCYPNQPESRLFLPGDDFEEVLAGDEIYIEKVTLSYSDSDEVESPKSSRPPVQNRAAHNELEKTRRAKLKRYMERLRDLVPSSEDVNKSTTKTLLVRSKRFIKALQEQEKKHLAAIDQLKRDQAILKDKLEQLRSQSNGDVLPIPLEDIKTEPSSPSKSIVVNSPKRISLNVNAIFSTSLPQFLKREMTDEYLLNNPAIPESGCLLFSDSLGSSPDSPSRITVLREVFTPAHYSEDHVCFIIEQEDDMDFLYGVEGGASDSSLSVEVES